MISKKSSSIEDVETMGFFQWLRQWFADRSYARYLQLQEWTLSLHEKNLTLKMIRNELKIRKIKLHHLEREEKLRKKSPDYVF